MREGYEVDDHFSVHVRLEDGAVILELIPDNLGVRKITVVGDGKRTLLRTLPQRAVLLQVARAAVEYLT